MSADNLQRLRKIGEELDELDKKDILEKEREVFLLVNALTDMVIVTDSEDNIKYANPSSFRILGYDPNDLIGRTAKDILKCDKLHEKAGSGFVTNAINNQGVEQPIYSYVGELNDGKIHLYITVIRKVI